MVTNILKKGFSFIFNFSNLILAVLIFIGVFMSYSALTPKQLVKDKMAVLGSADKKEFVVRRLEPTGVVTRIEGNSETDSVSIHSYNIGLDRISPNSKSVDILNIKNTTDNEIVLKINSSIEPTIPNIEVNLIFKGVHFSILRKGTYYVPELRIKSGENIALGLEVITELDINSPLDLRLELVEVELSGE